MTGAEFQNCVCSLANLSWGDLVDNGVVPIETHNKKFLIFFRDPFTWFLWLDEERAEKVWQLIHARQPKQDIVGR